MHKQESVQENKTISWAFEIQTDQPIPARRPDCI